jgi:PII-like signaling protein
MSSKKITIARVYTLEGHDHLNQVLDILHDQEKVMGATVIRGIAGYGASGAIHTSSLLNLSLELPLMIEFYDEPEKVARVIEILKSRLDLKHIVSWSAEAHVFD